MTAKPHHTLHGFRNPPGSPVRPRRPFMLLRFLFRRHMLGAAPTVIPDGHVIPRDKARAQRVAAEPGPCLTWIGHATFLIKLGNRHILTDPLFSERASPVGFAGPKRYAPPGLAIGDLPPIDLVLVSHNHYDSFDRPALKQLARHSPAARVLVPLGLAEAVRRCGFADVRALDWYETDAIGELTIRATPAIHCANRGLFDVNKTLWAGYTVAHPDLTLWFAGDTGFGPVFEREVAPAVGPVDVALVPIGAFLPRDFMGPVHVDPAEALALARIMGARTAIGMHWGTLPLGADNPEDAVRRFHAAPAQGVTKVLMRIGETRRLDSL